MRTILKKTMKEIKALKELPDHLIDLSDMREVTDWSGAVVGKFYRPVKKAGTIRLDSDVFAWLKSEGEGYQTRMNQILRSAMMQRSKQRKRAS